MNFSLEGAEGGAPIVRDVGELPLATRFHAGLGEVVLVSFDLAAGPFEKDDKARDAFWRDLLKEGVPPRAPQNEQRWAVAAPASLPSFNARQLLSLQQKAPILAIAFLALAYVLLIGPASFVFLRRRGQEPLMVLSIPVVASLFTLGTFAAGYGLKGVRLRVREVTFIEARAGSHFARTTRLLGISRARSTRVDVTLGRGEAAIAVGGGGGRRGGGDDALRYFRVEEGEREKIRGLQLMPWELGIVEAESIHDLGGGVSIALGKNTCQVRNDTPYDLKRVVLGIRATGYSPFYLAERVPARSTVTLEAAAESSVAARKALGIEEGYSQSSLTDRALAEALRPIERGAALVALLDAPALDDDAAPKADERACVLVVRGEAP